MFRSNALIALIALALLLAASPALAVADGHWFRTEDDTGSYVTELKPGKRAIYNLTETDTTVSLALETIDCGEITVTVFASAGSVGEVTISQIATPLSTLTAPVDMTGGVVTLTGLADGRRMITMTGTGPLIVSPTVAPGAGESLHVRVQCAAR